MTALDYILEGLEAELALERELGVRVIECDRAFLSKLEASASKIQVAPKPVPVVDGRENTLAETKAKIEPEGPILDFVFLHHQALSKDGNEMMAKIITAMGRTADTAPVIIAAPPPKAKVYVVLGGLALRKFFPEVHGEPGQSVVAQGGKRVLITYSPEYILRFKVITDEVQKIKRAMWLTIKSVLKWAAQ